MAEKTNKDIDDLRKQFMLSFHNDGLVDLFVGWAVVSAGLFMQTGLMAFGFLGWMPLIFIAPLKARIVMPRWGYAKFKRPNSIPWPVSAGLAALLVVGALGYTFLYSSKGGSAIWVAILGLGVLALLSAGLNRIAVYAIFIPVFFVAGLGLKFLTPWMVILVGAVLMLLGLSLLVLFLRKYPVIEEDHANE